MKNEFRKHRWISGFILFLFLCFGIGFFSYIALKEGWIWFVSPSKDLYPIRGIDVSHHQGTIRWNQVPKESISFVYIKATEGGDFVDPKFLEHWQETRAKGFQRGAYHFFTLCRSGQEQAEHFTKLVPYESEALPPVVDLEFEGNCRTRPKLTNVKNEIQTFLDIVDQRYKTKTILYLTEEFMDLYSLEDGLSHPIWIRNIFHHPNWFRNTSWIIWQFQSTGRIPGIRGPVDLNVIQTGKSLSDLYISNETYNQKVLQNK